MFRYQVKVFFVSLAISSLTIAVAVALTQHHVNQSALTFSVQNLSVQRGDTVVFSNGDRTSHNITATGPQMAFNGGLQRPGQDIEVTFTGRGDYRISCGIHPRMSMTVQVE